MLLSSYASFSSTVNSSAISSFLLLPGEILFCLPFPSPFAGCNPLFIPLTTVRTLGGPIFLSPPLFQRQQEQNSDKKGYPFLVELFNQDLQPQVRCRP